MEKTWKNIIGYENYLINNFGEIKSLKRNILLTPRKTDKNYYTVYLYNGNGKGVTFRIHRLVLSVFDNVDYRTHPFECNHLDEDKKNNNLNNLAWVTHKENMNWNGLSKRIKRNYTKSELRTNRSKEVNSKKITGENIASKEKIFFNSMADARKNGYSAGNISACCLGKRKKHKGFTWRFTGNETLGIK